jgi:DNA-binding transcriptional ArsR family regulator
VDVPEIPLEGRFAHAVSHPLRVQFLRLLGDRSNLSLGEACQEITRREIKGIGEVALSRVGYHATVLERFGLVELATPPTRRGGASFRATDTGELLILAIGVAPSQS